MERDSFKKIKVVIGINDFIIGGAQKLISDLLERFDHDKFEFHVVTLMQFNNKGNFYNLIPQNIQIHKLNFKGFFDISSWKKLYYLLKELKPDMVWSHLFFSNTVFRALSIFLKYKCIINEHNTYTWKNFFQRAIDRFLAKYTYKIVAVSETVVDFTSKQENIPIEKFITIHNGIDFFGIEKQADSLDKVALRRQYGISGEAKVFVNVARLTHQKNHNLIIEAFSEFLKKDSDSYLLIVGGGGLETKLKDLTKDLKINDNVIFFGSQSNVIPYLAMSDIFISTSLIEGFGISHIEAMACGLPVLSTKTAGPDKFIREGQNGFFISYDVNNIVQTMADIFSIDSGQLKSNIKMTAKSFDISNTVKKYEDLFLEVIN
ncbi:glycosyltransferase [Candidatus Nomurabacteria bacterium]|nr:glycosyltransferase [Candidatus Nomurabacteria bacterium]